MSETNAERMLRTMEVAAATLDAAGVERLEAENEELRAIVIGLAERDPRVDDPVVGDCTLCRVTHGHDTTCPYLRAVRFLSAEVDGECHGLQGALLDAYRQAFAANGLPVPNEAKLSILLERGVSPHELASLLDRGGMP